jgi:hypothetical protein
MDFKLWIENKNWIPGDPITDNAGNPIVLYHGTDKRFSKFNLKKSTMGIIWMTSDRKSIEEGTAGASGKGRIVSMHVSLKNPAGWKEYEKLLLFQLKSQGYDGAILENGDGSFDAFVFSPSQIKIIGYSK